MKGVMAIRTRQLVKTERCFTSLDQGHKTTYIDTQKLEVNKVKLTTSRLNFFHYKQEHRQYYSRDCEAIKFIKYDTTREKICASRRDCLSFYL